MTPQDIPPATSWQLEFQYVYDDVRQAQRAHVNRAKKPRRRSHFFGWLCFILLAIVIFIVLQAKVKPPVRPAPRAMSAGDFYNEFRTVIWAALAGAAWAAFYFWAQWAARR